MTTESDRTASGYVEVPGGRLYHERGGEGPTVVLVHGFGLDRRMWDPQMPLLAERFDVVRYDVRGFGRSTMPAGPFRHAEDLRALFDALRIDRARVLGLSMGGAIAIDFAIAAPDRTAALLLVDPALGGHAWSQAFAGPVADVVATARTRGVDAARERFLALDLLGPTRERAEAFAFVRRLHGDYSGWHWLHENPVRPQGPPAKRRLGGIAAPTLLLLGGRSLPDYHAVGEIVAAGVPNLRRVVLEGVGHLANLEDPALFHRAILGFLDEAGG